jgi:hypothetical protein
MSNCEDGFIGDYQTGTAKLIPATHFGVNLPGVVVIPENEIRIPRELCNPYAETCGNASDPSTYWQIHN